jgi:phospholipid-translocating ATPase
MQQLIISLDSADVKAAEDSGDKVQISKVSRASVEEQIASALRQIAQDADSDASHALIIDGKSLMYALEDGMKKQLLDLAVQCASVICCRVSPKQKAQVRLQPVLFIFLPTQAFISPHKMFLNTCFAK